MTTKEISIPIPRKLNDNMIQALSECIAKGNYPTVAAEICGVHRTSLYNWLKQGEADLNAGVESCYSTLVIELKRAEAIAEQKMVEVIREKAEVDREWLPAMVFLERRHPDRWGRKDRRTVDINERKDITITHVEYKLAEDVVESEARELESGQD